MELTRDEMVAAEMASRNFNEIIVPIIDQLISNEAKKGYASSILIGACAELSRVTGENFENNLDELIEIAKKIHREVCPKTPSKPS